MQSSSLRPFFALLALCLGLIGPAAGQTSPAPVDPFEAASSSLADDNYMVRRQGVEMLGRLGDAKTIPLLLKAAQDPHPHVRSTAAGVLGRRRIREAVALLVGMLSDDADGQVRQQAAVALGYLIDPAAIPGLIQALRDTAAGVRFAAAATLGRLRATEATPALEGLLLDKDPVMRREAATALGKIASPGSIGPLAEALQDSDAYVRRESARALGLIGVKDSKSSLEPLLEDPDIAVRAEAAAALATMGSERWRPVAIALLGHADPNIRRKAAASLGASGDAKEAFNALQSRMKTEPDSSVKNSIDFAVNQLKRRYGIKDPPPQEPAPVKKINKPQKKNPRKKK